jgi:hypothetical protein
MRRFTYAHIKVFNRIDRFVIIIYLATEARRIIVVSFLTNKLVITGIATEPNLMIEMMTVAILSNVGGQHGKRDFEFLYSTELPILSFVLQGAVFSPMIKN